MRLHSSLLSLAVSILFAAAACIAARAQTDVALSVYGAFSGTTNGSSVQESPSNSAGGMIEVRHIRNPLFGYEATYSFNRANQVYTYTGLEVCPAPGPCGPIPPVAVSANAHEITGDWVISAHAGKYRPFALAGVGLLLTEPISGQSYTQSSNRRRSMFMAVVSIGEFCRTSACASNTAATSTGLPTSLPSSVQSTPSSTRQNR